MQESGLFAQVNNSIRSLATEAQASDTWEFFCECPDLACHALVRLTVVEFDERRTAQPSTPIVATGHVG
jgi:hypothetical protein